MKRVLHIVSAITIESGVMGVLMNMYRHIDRSKVQFDFLYFNEYENSFEKEIIRLGGRCYKISRPNISLSSQNEIKKFFKENASKYVAIHNHEVYLNFIFSPIAKKHGINNVIVHSHTTQYSDKKLSAIRNKILCLPLKIQKNYKFACSKAAGSFLYGKKSIENNNVYILNNAIDTDKFKFNSEKRNKIRAELNFENTLVIGHVGRFNEQKNHKFLIEIFEEISKLRSDARLILVGSGPLEDDIRERVKTLKLEDKVSFLGRRNDINDLMQAMDVFVLPSLYEGLPVVGVEAQSTGLPCFMSTEITEEVALCNTKLISLSKGCKVWANEIINLVNIFERYDETNKIKYNNFEIKDEARKLEEFYLKLDC